MQYHVSEIKIGNSEFIRFEKETWEIKGYELFSPYGSLRFNSVTEVDNGRLRGFQFSVEGNFALNKIKCVSDKCDNEKIRTIALLKQPHNAWLWMYIFGDSHMPIAVICGYDDLDGFSRYVDKNIRHLIEESIF